MEHPLEEYANIILPLSLPDYFTYSIPTSLSGKVVPGMRVSVPFGGKKVLSGMVHRVHNETPERQVKPVLTIMDALPVVSPVHLDFWDWMADYYLCNPGDIMSAALPATLKPSSETSLSLRVDADLLDQLLNEQEYKLAIRLREGSMTLTEASKFIGLSKIASLVKNLIEKGIIQADEELSGGYQPKTRKTLRISNDFQDEENLQSLFAKLEKRALKQLETLMTFIHLQGTGGVMAKKEVMERCGATQAVLSTMINRGIFIEEEEVVSRFGKAEARKSPDSIILNEEQTEALLQMEAGFLNQGVVLLHGVTGSGKTELYIRLIDEVVHSQKKQVLYLVPEIALTSQLVGRLQDYFGDEVAVYHSRYNSQERAEIWTAVRDPDSSINIVLGARSAIFLPFENLGLIIVDEEHDPSFKQVDPAPRYHARDAAVYLGMITKAKVILGSATPSVESYFNAQRDKYALVELRHRYGGATLPTVIVADMEEAYKKRQVKSHFSETLVETIRAALEKKRQIILFQNRRGFSLRLECRQCQWMPQCKNCDVTLVYHKNINKLVCHYCGFQQRLNELCPECRSSKLQLRGFGTEKIEEELPNFFPTASIRRMDLDTTKGKQAHTRALEEFGSGRVDILVGTQMVTKGLDFDNVAVVGILSADNMLKFPDFRSGERSYQQFAQVSGRAGRKLEPGIVIIQTFDPAHPIIQQVINNDYSGMYNDQIFERRNFRYPPFIRLIRILLLHRNIETLNKASVALGISLRNSIGREKVLGPEFPMITRLRNMHQKQLLLKLDRSGSAHKLKSMVKESVQTMERDNTYKGIRIIIDVDPV